MGIIPTILVIYLVGTISAALITTTSAVPIMTQPSAVYAQNERESIETLVRSFIEEVFNQHNISAADRYLSVDYIQHNPCVPTGREGFKEYFGNFISQFPDFKADIEHLVIDDDNNTAVAFTHFTAATQPNGTSMIESRAADLWRVNDNGTLGEHWDVEHPPAC
jgi:predicted SnoaL-like aldol condensation-catalyzing enzyme